MEKVKTNQNEAWGAIDPAKHPQMEFGSRSTNPEFAPVVFASRVQNVNGEARIVTADNVKGSFRPLTF